MKKSEVIKILTDYLEGVTFKDDKGTAEDILYLLEEAGMIPPNQYACTNEFRFEWEDEDE